MSDIRACKDCDGTNYMHGVGDVGDGNCRDCHGTGLEGPLDALGDALTGQSQKCRTCDGSGDCQSCKGKGYFD